MQDSVAELMAAVLSAAAGMVLPPQLREYPDALHHLLPELAQDRIEQLAQRFIENYLKNEVVRALQKACRLEEVLSIVDCHGQKPLLDCKKQGLPVILAGTHLGVHLGGLFGVASLGIETTCFRNRNPQRGSSTIIPGLDIWEAPKDSSHAKQFLDYALSRLQNGGTVLLPMDGRMGENPYILACLGRKIPFSETLPMLQRESKAIVIPVCTHWETNNRISCQFYEPLDPISANIPQQLAAWMEQRILEDPSQIGMARLKEYIQLPLAEPTSLPSINNAATSNLTTSKIRTNKTSFRAY